MPISEATRRRIFRIFREDDISWSGRLEDIDFLKRLYDLDQFPSTDRRFETAQADIWQHTVNNDDWDKYWIFEAEGERFNLLDGPEDEFLRFLCETIHPRVRPDSKEAQSLLNLFNEELKPEGYQIVEKTAEFGSKRFEAIGLLPSTVSALEEAKGIAEKLGSEHIQKEIVRMTNAIERDPELAIGTAKEFLESICKAILAERGVSFKADESLPKLVSMTLESVKPAPSGDAKTEELLKRIVGNMNSLGNCIAELRNLHGTGHGKGITPITLEPMHAALAVNTASTIGLFLFQAHEKRGK